MAKKTVPTDEAPGKEPTGAESVGQAAGGLPPLVAGEGNGESYTVVARRYRPQQFSDLVGQEATAQALCNALTSNRVAHAYLFTGTRGVGKTSTARILAKALNCVHGPTPTPCDQCESCKAIAVGEDVDVMEIDGASNRNIDDIRELRQNVHFRPSRSRYKIYIIDEVHQLTKDSFNALLKTLEEPPPHVKFIFATTEANKVPATILSRCQRFDFASIPGKRLQDQLRRIVEAEGAEADAEAIELLARRAAGSMRDGQSLLDQALAFGGKRLTADLIHRLLGTANEDQVAELAAAALRKDVPAALTVLGAAADHGTQLGELLDQLIDYWRDLMVIKAAGPGFEGLNFPQRFHAAMKEQAEGLTLDTILAGLDVLANTKGRLRGATQGRVLVEMAVVRLTRLENLVPLAELARHLAQGTAPTARPVAQPSPVQNGHGTAKPVAQPPPGVKKNDPAIARTPEPASGTAFILTPENQAAFRAQYLAALTHVLRAHIEKAEFVANSAPNGLVIRFPARYNKDKEFCQSPNAMERLQQAARKLTGQPVEVRLEVAAGGVEVVEEGPKIPKSQLLKQAAAQEPLVKRAMDELDAKLLQTDDGFGQAKPRGAAKDREETADHV